MKITVQRQPSQGEATVSKLHIDDLFACYTLEDQIREVPGEPVSSWKIHGATAIPEGTYNVTLENSGRFGPNTLTVNDVPGFVAIRMHAGNTSADTEGCLLLGMAATNHSLIGGTSQPAVALVKSQVMKALEAGEEVTIEISNPVGAE